MDGRMTTATPGPERATPVHGRAEGSPDHLVALADLPGWWLWRCVGLRSAGFPAAGVRVLRDEACAAAALEVEAAEAQRARALSAASAAVQGALDGLRDGRGWTDRGRRSLLLNARRALWSGRVPGADGGDPDVRETLAAARAAGLVAEEARRGFAAEYGRARERTSVVLRELAGDPGLCEAILWQNRAAYHTAVLPVRAAASGRRRRREELLARYWQRYTVKNDTIGFFGPMGWAWVDESTRGLRARCGDVVGERLLFFEQWAVDAVADVLSAQAGLEVWMAPRRLPFAHLQGTTLYPLDGSPQALAAAEAAVLAACDGRRPAHVLARELVAAGVAGLGAVEDVYALLDGLRRRGLVVWRLEAPYSSRPEVALRALLQEVGDARLRARSLRTLDLLETARAGVARAAGDPERLDAALGVLGDMFERLTGQPAFQSQGRAYEGRAVVYEDCVRDLDVRVGTDLLGQAAPALALVLRSVSWLTGEIATRYRTLLHDLYGEFAAGGGDARVPLARLWSRLGELFPFLPGGDGADESRAVVAAREELDRRWRRILALDELGQRRVHRTSAQLRAAVAAAFPATPPAWPSAHYVNTDILLAAPDAAAVAAGEALFVIGEVHLANNTIATAALLQTHPDAAALRRSAERDQPHPRVVPVASRRWPGMTSRTRDALQLPRDWYVLVSHEFPSQAVEPARQLDLAELVVEPRGDELVVRSYDRRFEREAVEFLGELISIAAADAFRLFAGQPHVPRITIDRVVVQRESWSLPAAELAFAALPTPEERFRHALAWARRLGMPDTVFASLPGEAKPLYVDFASPILVEILARMVRRAPAGSDRVTFGEMLPGLDELWLTDAGGRRYTSELRIVAVQDHRATGPDAAGWED